MLLDVEETDRWPVESTRSPKLFASLSGTTTIFRLVLVDAGWWWVLMVDGGVGCGGDVVLVLEVVVVM